MEDINEKTRLIVPENVLFREIDGEAILLNTETGLYFGLDSVGSVIWAGLREYGSIEAVLPRLLEHYDTDAETLSADLLDFVGELVEQSLLLAAQPER